jgi:hypothetical protein
MSYVLLDLWMLMVCEMTRALLIREEFNFATEMSGHSSHNN